MNPNGHPYLFTPDVQFRLLVRPERVAEHLHKLSLFETLPRHLNRVDVLRNRQDRVRLQLHPEQQQQQHRDRQRRRQRRESRKLSSDCSGRSRRLLLDSSGNFNLASCNLGNGNYCSYNLLPVTASKCAKVSFPYC